MSSASPDAVFPHADWLDCLARFGADAGLLARLVAAVRAADRPVIPARVARAKHPLVTALTPTGPLRAGLGRHQFACAGDYVLIDPTEPAVTEIMPRRCVLVRHAAGNRTQPQTLAANVDDVFVTVTAERELSLPRIERFLALAWESGATPVLVLTKADLLPPGAAGSVLTAAAAVAPGADVHLVSALTGDGVADLGRRLGPGRTAALIGSSGAGKSSLLNALAGKDVAATMAVRDADGKGRHTTAWRELVVLDGGGAVIDTPGLRGLGMWLDEGGLDAAFADIAALAADCRFSDCRHDTEPGCAVTAAIEAGSLAARRLASYRKLEREAGAATSVAGACATERGSRSARSGRGRSCGACPRRPARTRRPDRCGAPRSGSPGSTA